MTNGNGLSKREKIMIPANIMAELLFAYENKDEDSPHDFELIAVKNAVKYLTNHYCGEKYSNAFFIITFFDLLKKRRQQMEPMDKFKDILPVHCDCCHILIENVKDGVCFRYMSGDVPLIVCKTCHEKYFPEEE